MDVQRSFSGSDSCTSRSTRPLLVGDLLAPFHSPQVVGSWHLQQVALSRDSSRTPTQADINRDGARTPRLIGLGLRRLEPEQKVCKAAFSLELNRPLIVNSATVET